MVKKVMLIAIVFSFFSLILTGCTGSNSDAEYDLNQYWYMDINDAQESIESKFEIEDSYLFDGNSTGTESRLEVSDGDLGILMETPYTNMDIDEIRLTFLRSDETDTGNSSLNKANVYGVKVGMDGDEAAKIISNIIGKEIKRYQIDVTNELQLEKDKILFFTVAEKEDDSLYVESVGLREGEADEDSSMFE